MMLLTSYIIKQILLSINKLVHIHMQWIKIKNVFIYVIASNKYIYWIKKI